MVESASDEILADADKSDVAFLVVGDPFGYSILTLTQSLGDNNLRLSELPHIQILFSEQGSSRYLFNLFTMPLS